MSVVFVTGMSGAGKSTVLMELERHGFETVDTDYGSWCYEVCGEQLWDVQKMSSLLSEKRNSVLYLSGTVSNQGQFYDQFDAVVLLTAPHHLLFERLDTRTNNGYGKTKAEREEIGRNILAVEPLLRETSTDVISTVCSVEEVVAALIQIGTVSGRPPNGASDA